MEKKINLTAEQIAVIEKQLKGEYDPFNAPQEETDALQQVVNDAEALMKELDAYDELEESLVEWYYNKYKAQDK